MEGRRSGRVRGGSDPLRALGTHAGSFQPELSEQLRSVCSQAVPLVPSDGEDPFFQGGKAGHFFPFSVKCITRSQTECTCLWVELRTESVGVGPHGGAGAAAQILQRHCRDRRSRCWRIAGRSECWLLC